ncbi:MAG: branched-chain amino acid ABC transporter substrate-binding protein [Propionibacteriaceae bacterium]|jgi:branched-chain amino acid transport system substrate-binding protein|nr:branched-chain amino acid ABC transporter substrate-binding protein [Propionibacteriaceae bacterium]
MKRKSLIVGAAALALLATMAGCGTRGEASSAEEKILTIGVIAPLTGDLSPFGKGIQYGAQLAVDQANAAGGIAGYTLQLSPQDDQATPDVGKNAATLLAGDDTVIGVVGTMNSSVAQPVIPVLGAANIPMVSPANTSPALTKGDDLTNPTRPNVNFFRLCASDDKQGPFAAKYLYENLGIKTVATVHDKKVYGQGLVEQFSAAFEALGGTVVAAETINPDDKDYNTVITKLKAANPEAIYYGGEVPQAAPLSSQAKAAGLTVPLMGGDGLYDTNYMELAGAAAEGDLATSVGAPTETLTTAQEFRAAYEAAGFDSGWSAYGAYAYDSANVIIAAAKEALTEGTTPKDARPAIIEAIGKVNFTGATGSVSFDALGDNNYLVLTVYKAEGPAWVAVESGEA